MSNKNPKGKKLTPRQEAAIAQYEEHRCRARIIERGVAVYLTEEGGYHTAIEVCSAMLQEALKLRKDADAVLRQAKVEDIVPFRTRRVRPRSRR